MAKHSRTSLAIIFVAVILSTVIACGSASTIVSPPITPAVLTSQTPANPRIQTIQFESKRVGKTLPYNVLLPVNYNQPESRSKRYPVIYLLHGFSGHYTNWLEKTKLVVEYGLRINGGNERKPLEIRGIESQQVG